MLLMAVVAPPDGVEEVGCDDLRSSGARPWTTGLADALTQSS
jgi:hypothetical protein